MKSKKSKKSKKTNESTPTEKEEHNPVEPTKPSISVDELNAIGITMMSSGLSIDRMNENEQRIQIMNESWEFTQLLIKQTIRATRKEVNDKLIEFFQTFPEALDPIKQQFITPAEEE